MNIKKKITKLFFSFGNEDPSFKQIIFNFILIFIPAYYFYPIKIFRNQILKLQGINLKASEVFIKSGCKFDSPQNISIGKNVFINKNVFFEGNGKIIIGNEVQIGPNTVFTTSDHDIKNNHEVKYADIKILENTWIGASVTIVPGVIIGPNVIIGAGSIVTKSFSNCKIVGNPAKIIN